MRISVPLLTVLGAVAGTGAAVVAYQTAAPVGGTEPTSSTTHSPAPAAVTSWLPCERGWKVKGDTCVRIKTKVVVVHDLPAPAAPQAVTFAGSSSQGSAGSSDDQGEDNAGENENEVEDQSDSAEHESEDAPDQEDVGGDD